jgi:hypothetical protein
VLPVQPLGHLPQPVFPPCDEHEVEPLRGEHIGKGFTDAGRRAGD